MKKALFCLIMLLFLITHNSAQIFNTSSTLKNGQFSAGFEPSIFVNGSNDFNLFLHGGVGITSGVDFGLKLGIMGNNVYLGGDVEFALSDRFSVVAGAHSFGNFGLDFTGLYTLSLGTNTNLYTGLDADMNFTGNKMQIPLWIPLGLEIPVRKHIMFYFETEINLTTAGSHFIGSGINFLF